MSSELSASLEKSQRRALLAVTRAYQKTSTQSLLEETNMPPLSHRRTNQKKLLFYKIMTERTPAYLKYLVPPTRKSLGIGPATRNADMITAPATRTESFRTSFIPSAMRQWNVMDNAVKTSTSVGTFKHNLQSHPYQPLDTYGIHNCAYGLSALEHSRIRMGLSGLKGQRAAYNLIEDGSCDHCGWPDESAVHYLLLCPHHAASRTPLLRGVEGILRSLGVEMDGDRQLTTSLLLHGSQHLSHEDNNKVTNLVQTFIKQSKRFN